jgi:hypothetical protein
MDSNWKKLIEKYADGRPICNCRCAYYSPTGRGIDGVGIWRTDMLVCEHGCSANQITARDEIAGRVIADLANARGVTDAPVTPKE